MHRFEQPLAEFELGDWRDHRRARLITFDHGLFNFEDFDYEDSEKGKLVVSVTNPKPKAQYLSGKEPLERIEKKHSYSRCGLFVKCHRLLPRYNQNSVS